ncbi:MAG TPA: hypothetical protein VHS31_06650 [Tepidisphaeraceae bacterium]|jgi:hypothetical protein|nr:hypothetical protein [Tepidisphaeraceae bacterium]
MMKRWLFGAAMALMSVSVVVAKPGVVVTNTGAKYDGDITEKGDQYIINIHGVDTLVPRDSVASVAYSLPFDDEFADRMSKLAANDIHGRIAVARWAFNQHQYAKAREALDSAQAIDPNNREAFDLQNLITSQLRLEQSKPPVAAATQPVPLNPIDTNQRLLSNNDINIMRQKELLPGDHVNVRFENNVDRRFVEYAKLPFNQFNALLPVDKALMILAQGDETMKPSVKILNDPDSIVVYRRTVEPSVLNGCAASNCHGGPNGGSLILYNPADNEAKSYTNLYILSRYKMKLDNAKNAGTFVSSMHKMINRGEGVQSILAQLSLPPQISALYHPSVPGYKGIFNNALDPRFRQIVEWMDHSLKQDEPDYGIKFDPPRTVTTAPASRPAP